MVKKSLNKPNNNDNIKKITLDDALYLYRAGRLIEEEPDGVVSIDDIKDDKIMSRFLIDVYSQPLDSASKKVQFWGPGKELIEAVLITWRRYIQKKNIIDVDTKWFHDTFFKIFRGSQSSLNPNNNRSEDIMKYEFKAGANNTLGRWERKPQLRSYSAIEKYVGNSYDFMSFINDFGFLYDSNEEAQQDVNVQDAFLPILLPRVQTRLNIEPLHASMNTTNTITNARNTKVFVKSINYEIPEKYNPRELVFLCKTADEWRDVLAKRMKSEIDNIVFNNYLDMLHFAVIRGDAYKQKKGELMPDVQELYMMIRKKVVECFGFEPDYYDYNDSLKAKYNERFNTNL